MTKKEKAFALRNDPKVHYNCAQAVLMTFAQECGISEETAAGIGANFGSGMQMGSVCGAVTGGLMALGAMGYGKEYNKQFLDAFKDMHHGKVNCVDLLREGNELGQERKYHCDLMINQCVELVEQITGK